MAQKRHIVADRGATPGPAARANPPGRRLETSLAAGGIRAKRRRRYAAAAAGPAGNRVRRPLECGQVERDQCTRATDAPRVREPDAGPHAADQLLPAALGRARRRPSRLRLRGGPAGAQAPLAGIPRPLRRDAAVARGTRPDRRCAARPRGARRRAARRLSCERPSGAHARDEDRQAVRRGSASAADATSRRRSPTRFPATRHRSRSSASRRPTGSVSRRQKPSWAMAWRLRPAVEPARARIDAQRKGPAIKGSAAGPETPVAGLFTARAPAQGGKRETLPSASVDR